VAQVIAIAEPLPWILGASPEFLPSFWAHLNAIPFIIRPPTLLFDDLPEPSPEYYASAAVTAAIKHLHPASHSAIAVGVNSNTHEVLVDADGQIRIASLKEYEQSTSPRLWRRFMALVRHVKARNIKVVFASATPAGGGVALMR
jgi:alpha,alpha-trehalose phosphorylase (configuration-retaining)